MLKLSSSRGIRIDAPVLSVSWFFEDHSVIIQALRKGLIEHEASDTGGVPRWKSSCPDRLAEATVLNNQPVEQTVGVFHHFLLTKKVLPAAYCMQVVTREDRFFSFSCSTLLSRTPQYNH